MFLPSNDIYVHCCRMSITTTMIQNFVYQIYFFIVVNYDSYKKYIQFFGNSNVEIYFNRIIISFSIIFIYCCFVFQERRIKGIVSCGTQQEVLSWYCS